MYLTFKYLLRFLSIDHKKQLLCHSILCFTNNTNVFLKGVEIFLFKSFIEVSFNHVF